MKTKKPRLVAYFLIAICATLAACGQPQKTESGVYVLHMLFPFSEQQLNYINQIIATDISETELADLLATTAQSTVATNDNGEQRPLFGADGVYQEIATALDGLIGVAALHVFEQYLALYNNDPGMESNPNGYFVPLEGETMYVQSFTELARALFNPQSPATSIGNAFIDQNLAYCHTIFGTHILIIKSVTT